MAYKLTVVNYDRQTSNVAYSSAVAHQYMTLLTFPDHNMPPMEADTAYQGCLKSCNLHSRSLAVGHTGGPCTGACNLEIVHTCYVTSRLPAQSQDSENAQRNLEIAQILRLHGTYRLL